MIIEETWVAQEGESPYFYVRDSEDAVHGVHLDALASWSELLGYDDQAEVLSAILQSAEAGHNDQADPKTGRNAWTDAYELLSFRERAREDEARRAIREGTQDDPRSPRLRSTLAAYNAVHQPIAGGECAMDRCRRDARSRLGLEDPSRKCGADSRLRDRDSLPQVGDVNDSKAVRSNCTNLTPLLEEVQGYVQQAREGFLHSVCGTTEEDPLAVEEESEPEQPMTAEELIKKYQEESEQDE